MRLDLSDYLPKLTIDVPIRPPQRWFRHLTLAWIAGLGLVGLAALVALLPALMSARYRVAGEAAINSDAGGAAAAFQQALQWSPDDPQIYRALAQSYLRLNQPQAAIDALERAYRLRPDSLLIQQELAQAYEAGGQIERADRVWAALGLPATQMLSLGQQARQAKRYAEALAWCMRAARAAPQSGEPLVCAARVYRDVGEIDQSLQVARQATTIAPALRDSWYELGQSYAAHSDWQPALETFRRGLDARDGRVGQSNLHYWIGYVSQYIRSPRDLETAWAAYEQAEALDAYAVDAWQKIETYHQKGVILAWQKRWAPAIEEYRRALASNPQHYGAHLSLASALWHVGQRAEAIAQARQAMTIDPNRKSAYSLLGDFYTSEHDLAEASAMYARVLELDPSDKQARTALEALR